MELAEAAERLGVHYQTAYRWVREGRLPAVRVRGRYQLTAADVDAFAAERDRPREVGPARGRRSWERLADRLFEALRAGDERTATDLVQRLHAQQETVLDVISEVIAPALARIGDDWHTGDLSIVEEHRASEIAERLLVSLDQRRVGRPRGRAVVAGPEGEQHGLPIAMAAAALRQDGWTVELLGRDVPLDSLAHFVDVSTPDLVVLTVTSASAAPAATAARDRLAAGGHAVLVGGRGRTLEQLVQHARAARSAQRQARRTAG
jgi:MerR family transcriptional regulator, light-induced transcriptional regulator